MNVIRQILNRQVLFRPQFYRQITISSNHQKNDEKWRHSRNYNRLITVGICGGICLAGYELMKKYLPQVHAATQSTGSRRAQVGIYDTATFFWIFRHFSHFQFNFIADVVEIAAKSLVYIEIQDTKRMDYMTGRPATVSNGSGFIIESNGLILTNAHVVINKPRSIVSVRLNDGRTFQGIVEAVDPVSDLATVRINCKNLPTMKLGTSSSLRSGEFVVALGSPLALSNTVTSGVVSSTQRPSQELGLHGRDINYIQTDAAITFGNSGGPLVNLDGEAIGINSMKVTAGISFAIPIDYVKNFLKLADEKLKKGKSLVDRDEPKRRYMGITMLSLTPDIIRELKQRGSNIPDNITHGILVWKVISGSPSQIGGLMAGDIITSINGVEVSESSDIYEILAGKQEILIMNIFRGRTHLKVAITPDPAE